jgi:restriction system protein
MALWLVRSGRYGEHTQRFLDEKRIYLTWDGLNSDLSKLASRDALLELLADVYPQQSPNQRTNHVAQIWAFVKTMKPGDWIVMPNKGKATVNIGEITGEYVFHADGEDPYFHSRAVKWVALELPRSNFDQDLLYSFGAIQTICRIERNDAEKRVRAMQEKGWKGGALPAVAVATDAGGTEIDVDLQEIARDQIGRLVIQKFKGHGMALLVEAVLKAQGYTTYRSPEGADKGIDILAAPGPLGFGRPRLCVQVKSGESPADLPTLNQLIGAMQNVQADQGLLVSWGGFKSSVYKELPAQFFRVRLWDQNEFLDELLTHYEKLSDELRAELPLKRVWTVAAQEEGD